MDGWYLKIQRAEKHMVDINQEAMRYAESHPYTCQRIRFLDSDDTIWGRFHITKQPDPMIAVMLGDFIHNLRSALDWVIVACSPRKHRYKASFPILSKDVFAKDADGNFVFGDTERKNLETCLQGLCPEARALVIGLQPYNMGANTHRAILGIISRLENADKHREIITIGCGGRDFRASLSIPDFPRPVELPDILATGEDFLKNNTMLRYVIPPKVLPFVHPSEVDVQLTGTVKVLVKVSRPSGNQPPDLYLIDSIMDMALLEVSHILNDLEVFSAPIDFVFTYVPPFGLRAVMGELPMTKGACLIMRGREDDLR